MVKFVDQAIPQDLVDTWNALTAPGKLNQGTSGTARAAKKLKKVGKRKKQPADVRYFYQIATTLARMVGMLEDNQQRKDFIHDQAQALMVGVFDQRYWRKLTVTNAVSIESMPTSVADPSPPAYAYRSPENMPTIPSYPAGSYTSGVSRYIGATVAGLFKDSSYRWRRQLFVTPVAAGSIDDNPIVMSWVTTIAIDTSMRGSRPMVSVQAQFYRSAQDGSQFSSTTPPLVKKTSFYWRFKVPPSTVPFYHSSQLRRITKVITPVMKKDGNGTPGAIVIKSGVRPMMGRGFNNNTSIQTTSSNDPELYAFKPCINGPKTFMYKTPTYTPPIPFPTGFVYAATLNLLTGASSPIASPFSADIYESLDTSILTKNGTAGWHIRDSQGTIIATINNRASPPVTSHNITRDEWYFIYWTTEGSDPSTYKADFYTPDGKFHHQETSLESYYRVAFYLPFLCMAAPDLRIEGQSIICQSSTGKSRGIGLKDSDDDFSNGTVAMNGALYGLDDIGRINVAPILTWAKIEELQPDPTKTVKIGGRFSNGIGITGTLLTDKTYLYVITTAGAVYKIDGAGAWTHLYNLPQYAFPSAKAICLLEALT